MRAVLMGSGLDLSLPLARMCKTPAPSGAGVRIVGKLFGRNGTVKNPLFRNNNARPAGRQVTMAIG